MSLIYLFILFSILTFIFLLTLLAYNSILEKNEFICSFKKIIQMESIKDDEIKSLLPFVKDNFRYRKLWFSYLILEKNMDKRFLNRVSIDFNSNKKYIKSAVINYLTNFKKTDYTKTIFPFLKDKNLILKFHSIHFLTKIAIHNFDFFKNQFEKESEKFVDVALNIFDELENKEKKDLFFIIKKYFSKNENIILKTLDNIDEYLNEKEMEELLFQLDIFPIPFQIEFLKIFSKKMEIIKYFGYFDFKFKTTSEKLRIPYIYFFSAYYSELDYTKTIPFLENLNEKEIELFFKNYFPNPGNFLNLLLNFKKEISLDTAEIILEKLSLLKDPKTFDSFVNIIEKVKQRDKLIFKFSILINDWKNEEIKPFLFWALTKIENPFYREKISNIIKEKNFGN